MSKDRILDMLSFDKKTIKDFIKSSGRINTMRTLEPCFTQGPTSARIPDATMRLMLWNIHHSLEDLESMTKIRFINLDGIETLARTTKDVPTRTISNHIIGGFDALLTHVEY